MDIFGLFSSWRKGSSSGQNNTDSMDNSVGTGPPILDNFPDLVLLNLCDYLDRASLNKLRQISATARDVIENLYGIHVIVPARDYLTPPAAPGARAPASTKPSIHVSVIKHIVSQMEGKVIHTLEMSDMPAPYAPFDLDKAIHMPGKLRHVKLNYCGVRLLYDVLVKCKNLASFQYTTNSWRGITPASAIFYTPPIPMPASGHNLLGEIITFPCPNIKLEQLKKITLTLNKMTRNNSSDWGNVIFLFLFMPVLPSLNRFEFEFHPNMLISWRTHLAILSCLAEFLTKTPKLQVFRYNSTFDDTSGAGMFPDWRALLFGLIEKHGSTLLKTFGQAASTIQPPLYNNILPHVRNIWNAAGTSLGHLQDLDVELLNSSEHAVFTNLVSHLPAVLKKFKMTDFGEEDVDPNVEVANVYQYFAAPLERDRNRRLAVYDSVRTVQVNLKFTRILPTSLTNILIHLPQLKELDFESSTELPHIGMRMMANEVRLEDYADSAVFQKLEKLSLINVCLWCQPTSLPVLAKFKGLRELTIIVNEDIMSRLLVMPGIQTNDMLPILANLPKLDKVHAKPLLSPPATILAGQGDNVDPLVVRDFRNRSTLNKVGTLLGLQMGEVPQNMRRPSAYEFTFDSEI